MAEIGRGFFFELFDAVGAELHFDGFAAHWEAYHLQIGLEKPGSFLGSFAPALTSHTPMMLLSAAKNYALSTILTDVRHRFVL